MARRAAVTALLVQPSLGGVALPIKDQVHSLGIVLIAAMLLDVHVSAIGAFVQLWLACHLLPFLSQSHLTLVTKP